MVNKIHFTLSIRPEVVTLEKELQLPLDKTRILKNNLGYLFENNNP